MAAPEFFNPAGLDVLQDRRGAIAYGLIAPRVLYTRAVGSISVELASRYLASIAILLRDVTALAYFADASALGDYDWPGRASFANFVKGSRAKFGSLVVLTGRPYLSASARAFATSVGEPVTILCDPMEFERLLSNVAPAPQRRAKKWEDAFPHQPPSAFRS